jgi:hypothetical protein
LQDAQIYQGIGIISVKEISCPKLTSPMDLVRGASSWSTMDRDRAAARDSPECILASDSGHESSSRFHEKRKGTKGCSPAAKNSSGAAVFGLALEWYEGSGPSSMSRCYGVRNCET